MKNAKSKKPCYTTLSLSPRMLAKIHRVRDELANGCGKRVSLDKTLRHILNLAGIGKPQA